MLRQLHKLNLSPKTYVYYRSCLHYGKKVKKSKTLKEDPVEINKKRALKSFDDLYKKIYGDQWHSMRVALLCPSKKALLLNNFSDIGKVINEVEDKGLLSVFNTYEYRLSELTEHDESEKGADASLIKTNSRDEREALKEENEKYFRDRYEKGLKEKDDTLDDHLSKKVHEDPTVNLPLEETLASAEIDQSRIIEPQVTGTSLSAALLEFVPPSEIIGKNPDWILNSEQFLDYERSSNVIVDEEFEDELHFPPNLHVYSYERGNVEEYDAARMGASKTLDYIEVELSSLLPVLALGIEPNDNVLDMCTQNTDYGSMMLQTLYPKSVRMNIHSDMKISWIHRILNLQFKETDHITYTVSKQMPYSIEGDFNKILLCVPNMDDRNCLHSAHTYFNPMLSKDRLLLPDEQAEHLIEAMQLVQPGGTVVYSTSTLSPLQNEGVIRTAIGRLRYEYGIEVKVMNLTRALKPLDCFFKFASRNVVGLGHLALPFLPLNCGPRYVCKLVKVPGEGNDLDDQGQLNG